MADFEQEKEETRRLVLGFVVEAQKQIVSNLQTPKKPVIILAGPTAVGKSDFSLVLAKEIGGEIVSADAMQIYRGMDIGTAKIPIHRRQGVPHHMIDVRDVSDSFSVVDFFYEARSCLRTIHDKGAIPIVVGGSGFYLHSLIYGPPMGPPSVPEVRQTLEEELEKLGVAQMYARLSELDPEYAKTITKNDKQKIVRGLEIISVTGKKVSKLSWKAKKRPQTYDFHCWFLHRPRDVLYKRIDLRCEQMVASGLLEEVAALKSAGLEKNSSASQAIGYKQALEFLTSQRSTEDYQRFIHDIQQSSRRYAKRQLTWFRREPFRWVDLDLCDPEILCDMIRRECSR
jgi:tRNA dimethylallyltransferase